MHAYLNYQLKRAKRGILARMALWSPRTSAMLATERPLHRLEYRLREGHQDLIVFLPGIGDLAEDFHRRGFIREMEQQGLAADAVAVDAHFGYYASRAIHHRLNLDVIASARRTGYKRIWLAGISLGGFGAATYAALHGSRLAGLILLAPYLGPPALIREITMAGGLIHWDPGHVAEDDYQRRLWEWFKQHLIERPSHSIPIYLGYGRNDMFRKANRLLADALPPDRVFLLTGGHNWRTWRRVWRKMLQMTGHSL